MKLRKKIEEVAKLQRLGDNVTYLNLNGEVYDINQRQLFEGACIVDIKPFADYYLGFSKQKDKLIIFDTTFKLVSQITGYYPHLSYKSSNNIFVLTKKEKRERSILLFDNKFTDRLLNLKPSQVIGDKLIIRTNSDLSVYDDKENRLWSVSVKDKGNALVWNAEQKEEVEEENTIAGDLLNFNDKIAIIPLNGGQLLAVEMATGKELWMLEEPKSGRPVIYKDKIYAQSYPNIIEINARNGKILRSIDLTDVRQKYNFDLTGQLEVFEDYLFAFSPDGKIAMIDRERFSIVDFIEFEGTIPNNHGHLIWHDKKLYVHIWGDALLVFEKE